MARISIWLIARLRGRKEFSSERKPFGSSSGVSSDEPGVDDPVGAVGDPPRHSLAHQAGERRDPLGELVLGVDEDLDPSMAVVESLRHRLADRLHGRAEASACSSSGQRDAGDAGGDRGQLGGHGPAYGDASPLGASQRVRQRTGAAASPTAGWPKQGSASRA